MNYCLNLEKIENKILRRIKEISCNRIDYKKRYDSGEKLNFDIMLLFFLFVILVFIYLLT